MRFVPALVVLVGCGRFGFDSHPTDAGSDGGLVDSPAMVGAFTDMKLPPGGHVRALAMHDTFALYYVGYAGGRVFRVVDGVWSECTPLGEDIQDMALAKDGTLYIARYDDQLAYSTDNCASYSVVNPPKAAYAVTASDVNAFVGGYDGIWQFVPSTGMFSRFTSPFDGQAIHSLGWASGSRFGVAAIGSYGVYHNGAWHSTSIPGYNAYHVVFDPLDTTVVYAALETGIAKSTTSGDTFNLTAWTGYHDYIAIDPANTQRSLSMEGGELDQSLDGLTTVDGDKRDAVTGKGWPATIAFDPAGTGKVLMATETGVFAADDSSLAWKRVDVGIDAWWVDATAESSTTLYAGASGRMHVSHAGGAWTEGLLNAQSSAVYGVTASLTDPNRAYAMGDALERTDDGGMSFSTVLPSSQTDGWSFYGLTEQGSRLWASSYARLTYSDNGSTFTQASLGGISRFVRRTLVRANGTEIVVTTDGGVWWSIDNGTSFAASNTGLSDIDLRGPVVELPDGRIVIANADGLWITTARGATWTQIGFAGTRVRDLLVTPSGALVAAVPAQGVFVSHDNGASFSELPGLTTYRPWSLAKGQGSTLLVGTQGHGLFRAALP